MSPSTSRATIKAQFPDWQKQQDAIAEGELISPVWHQNFKWRGETCYFTFHTAKHTIQQSDLFTKDLTAIYVPVCGK